MAKVSMVNRELKRQKLVAKFAEKRAKLKEKAKDQNLTVEERFKARLALAKLPRNSATSRLHNRCLITGRPKGYYRKIKMSRIALRDMASRGEIPGMIKSSW